MRAPSEPPAVLPAAYRAMPDVGQRRRELWATVLLSVATLLTAWSAFQATKWSDVMTIRFSEANAARTQSGAAAARASSQRTLDVTVFTSYVEAVAAERAEQRQFIEDRFRAEFRPAFEAWVATRPRTSPSAPSTPFAMPEYQLAEERRSAELSALAIGLTFPIEV